MQTLHGPLRQLAQIRRAVMNDLANGFRHAVRNPLGAFRPLLARLRGICQPLGDRYVPGGRLLVDGFRE